MSPIAAVLDANVLCSYPLTSVLLELAEARLFRPIWSVDIHAEWMRAVRRIRPEISVAQIERRRWAMDSALPNACVGGYRSLVDGLNLPDPDDRHVLAAAIRAKAQLIVTFNGRDFPDSVLHEFDLVARHPDSFVCQLIDLSPQLVRSHLRAMIANLKRPPMSVEAYMSVLERQSLPNAVAALRELFIAH